MHSTHMNGITVSSIYIYPIKSTTGTALTKSHVHPQGIEWDRRWALFDSANEVITAREFPKLLDISTTIKTDGLAVHLHGSRVLTLPLSSTDKSIVEVVVFDEPATGVETSASASEWFSQYLGVKCQLIFMGEACHREVLPAHGGRVGDALGYADECPLLLVSEASLEGLNARLKPQIGMNRFRPNIVVRGCEPHAEDAWQKIRIGDREFDVSQQCKRCELTTIDAVTKVKHERQEPLRTLSSYHRHPRGGVAFGIHLIPRSSGPLHTGDTLTVVA